MVRVIWVMLRDQREKPESTMWISARQQDEPFA